MKTYAKVALFVFISVFSTASANALFSLKPKPLPDCKTFLISEIGYFYRFTSAPKTRYKHPHNIIASLGFMVNLSDKISLGVCGYAHGARGNNPKDRLGIKARAQKNQSESLITDTMWKLNTHGQRCLIQIRKTM